MAAWEVILCVILSSIKMTSGQELNGTYNMDSICSEIKVRGTSESVFSTLRSFKHCAVVIGSVRIAVMENLKPENFEGISFPHLKEIGGSLVIYRVSGLDSVGQLFPNLVRIRGYELINDFALIVHDMPDLLEIGLYSLMKVDRGSIVVGGNPQTCYIDSVDWWAIAPHGRRVLNLPEPYTRCSVCRCSLNLLTNRCWNIKKCQRFLQGEEAENCHDQCFGCRNVLYPKDCLLCRYYTYRGRCISKCPENTIILERNKYCITEEECLHLHGWKWNDTCVFECPFDYAIHTAKNGTITCRPCPNCNVTCESSSIHSLELVQEMERCVYINGSLTIHIRAVPDIMEELRHHFRRLVYVSDFIAIFGSLTITSLDFFSSLTKIEGKNLRSGKNSLVIYNMQALQTLFSPNITKSLKIKRGSLSVYNNPMLCHERIDELKQIFQDKSDDVDIPQGMNGYSGGCSQVAMDLQIRILNETSALVMFVPDSYEVKYSILYVRLPPGVKTTVVPETCSEFEWFALDVPVSYGRYGAVIELSSLNPASTYAFCIETYDPLLRHLARTPIINFTTPVGKPEPPFIFELVASSSDVVVLRWVDHNDYRLHITHYELDVSLVEYHDHSLNYCRENIQYFDNEELEYSRHAVVLIPPPEYHRGCESMCGVLASATKGAMVDEHFDICSSAECNIHEADPPSNSTFGNYVQTMNLNLSGPRDNFQVGSLAPYRDYRFRLRACAGEQCSRSFRGVVRTLPLKDADVPNIVLASANDEGTIIIEWEPPRVLNGAVLTYFVKVLPGIEELPNIMPHVWCVLPDKLKLTVKSKAVSKYKVNVCATTLVSNDICTDWKEVRVDKIVVMNNVWIGFGILFGVIMFSLSCIIGRIFKRTTENYDTVPLMHMTPLRNLSEPPSLMHTDFIPVYSIPLRDTPL